SSGGLVRGVVNGTINSIGYMGLGDFNAIAGNASTLNYNGVPYAHTNVANGSYAVWGYEHLVNRVGGLSANQTLIRDGIIAAITEPSLQATNLLYAPNFVSLVDMQVDRGADGGPITSKNF